MRAAARAARRLTPKSDIRAGLSRRDGMARLSALHMRISRISNMRVLVEGLPVKKTRAVAAFGGILAMAMVTTGAAIASPPGAGDRVYGPEVEKGEVEIEFRGSRINGGPDGGEGAYVYEASYGLTDWWRAGAVLETENEPNGPLTVEAIEFENIIELPRIPGLPIDFGIYAEYEAAVGGGPDAVELRWLAEVERGAWNTKFNFNVERAFGGGETFEMGYGFLSTVEVVDDVALGVEAFGDFGTAGEFGFSGHEHYIGPALQFEIEPRGLPGELEIEASYLFGAGAAGAEGQARLLLEWEFEL